MSDTSELKNTILEGTITVFNEKGMKFTMEDLAKYLGMSKKTIYTVFREKNELLLAMVDYLFDGIKKSEELVLEDERLNTVEKIRTILGVLPEGYKEIDFRQLYQLRDKYPESYFQGERRLEGGWESTIELIEQGIREGSVRNVRVPIVKMMLEASLEQFFQRDILVRNQVSYQEALNEVVEIIVDGIVKTDDQAKQQEQPEIGRQSENGYA